MADKVILNIDTGNSVNNIRDIENELAKLREDIKDVEIGSDAFKEMATKIQNAESKVKTLNKQMEGLEPQQKAEAFLKMGEGIAGSFAVASGAMAIFGAESERMQELQTRVQGAIAIAMGVRMISEAALQSVTARRVLTEKASAVATMAMSVANKIATTTFKALGLGIGAGSKALQGFKAALISTGIGALVVLIGSAIGAMMSFASSNKEFEFSQDEVNASMDEAGTQFDKYIERLQLSMGGASELALRTHDLKNVMGDTIGNARELTTKIAELEEQQRQLRLEAERLAEKGLLGRPGQAQNRLNEADALNQKIAQMQEALDRANSEIESSIDAHNKAREAEEKQRKAIADANKERERQLALVKEFNKFKLEERPILQLSLEQLARETEMLELQLKDRESLNDEQLKRLEDLESITTAEKELETMLREEAITRTKLSEIEDEGARIKQKLAETGQATADESAIYIEFMKLEELNAKQLNDIYLKRIQIKKEEEDATIQTAQTALELQQRLFEIEQEIIGMQELSIEAHFQNEVNKLLREEELKMQELELTEATEEEKLKMKELYNAKFKKLDEDKLKAIKQSAVEETKTNADLAGALLGTMGGMFSSLGQLAGNNEKAKKKFALAGIIANTASGIAGAVSAGAGVPFPGNLGAIASGIASVLAGIASAKQAMQGADEQLDAGLNFVGASGGGGGGGGVVPTPIPFELPTIPDLEGGGVPTPTEESGVVKAYVVSSDVISGTALEKDLELQSTL